jgi:hypothetical protein
MIVKKCSSSGVDQPTAAKMNALRAYMSYYQGKDASLVDYHRGA